MAIRREKYINFLIKQKDKDIVKIITGIRRSGKSTLLFELYYEELISMGVVEDHIIKIALDNIKNADLLEARALYQNIEGQIKDEGRYYVFLDEVQMVNRFEDVVNGIKRDFNCDVYITGSNSEFLSSDISTKFRGRGIELRVYPFSFKESYDFYGTDKYQLFSQYMLYGGMPYLLQEEDPVMKKNYLQMVAETVELNNTYYIQVSYSVIDPATKDRELASFINLDDGYKKILITMDNDPFTNLEKGYKKINMIDFLLDEKSLEKI